MVTGQTIMALGKQTNKTVFKWFSISTMHGALGALYGCYIKALYYTHSIT